MRNVYCNGIVYTGSFPLMEGFIEEEGKIVEVSHDIRRYMKEGDLLIDLKGRFVCAGFNDSHMHLLNLGNVLYGAQLQNHTDTLQGMLEYLKEYRDTHGVSWIKGRGWNQDCFTDTSRMPNRYDLDTVSTEIPIMITRACGHVVSLNSKALELAGINENTMEPSGGAIGRTNNIPNGILYENAIELVDAVIPLPTKKEIKDMIILACKEVNRHGITSVQSDDYAVFRGIPYTCINDAYMELIEEGRLTVKVYEQCNFTDVNELNEFIHKGRVKSEMFTTGPLKIVADGSLGGRTAHLTHPYDDDPNTCGFSLLSQDILDDLIQCANSEDMQVAVHAIGDACLDEVLLAVEKALKDNPRVDHRHGIVHCQISRRDQLEKIKELQMHVYAQSIFLDYDNHIVEKRVGKELASTSYNWKSLRNMGVTVSNGSDCPVETPSVMKGIQCAVTRTSFDGTGPYLPEQAFTVPEAIDSYTIESAYASFEEHKKGRIMPGYVADFVVLEDNPFDVDPKELHRIQIQEVYLNGKKIYDWR